MTNDKQLIDALTNTITVTDLPLLGKKISGKVRDCYVVDQKRILVSSDRISAFDVILSSIPFKGQLLNDLTAFWFQETASIIPNHIISRPHPNVFVAKELNIVPFEVVVRGYLSGSAWRDYQAGKPISGITLPSGLKKSERLPSPVITPSTKEASGAHDQPISREEILKGSLVGEVLWHQIEDAALKLFEFASNKVAQNGLLLFDTKFEFGVLTAEDGTKKLYIADEIFTQDCSRYAVSSSYERRLSEGKDPEMLDKEFIRAWLMERGYMGEGTPPTFPDDFRIEIAKHYITAYEIITGEKFRPYNDPINQENIIEHIKNLNV